MPGVTILKDEELFVSYSGEFWYRKWHKWTQRLRLQILDRYPLCLENLEDCNYPKETIAIA